ncbi:hypothetical protein [Flagellimonas pacifica]|uniref:Uncharacterized protein n=1 Tax=Flagellimonas pacifica TaxID=1247520 RepID=A0A285MCE8_9FLAO|nr:hypothetical protein [Allomuricauda parva]SNY94820.1 hypothetical protein SAMN06265377_0480 [Allomuricauda parva]
MLKTIAHPMICLMLIFSILTPSIISLLNKDCAVVVLLDTNDEEKQEKESEKKIGEKNLFAGPFDMNNGLFFDLTEVENIEYLLFNTDYMAEIFLPPPEKLV